MLRGPHSQPPAPRFGKDQGILGSGLKSDAMSAAAASRNKREFDPATFLATIGRGRKNLVLPKKRTIFAQGDQADAVFYIQIYSKRQSKTHRCIQIRQGSYSRHTESGGFFWRRRARGADSPHGICRGHDGLRASAHREESHDAGASPGAHILRHVRRVSA